MAIFPVVKVEFAFGQNITAATPTYTDCSSYFRAAHISRGRRHELRRFEAGELEIILDNADLRFDPGYSAGAYNPDVIPLVRVRVSATWSAVEYRLFTGYVLNWDVRLPKFAAGKSEVVVRAVDAFHLLQMTKITDSYAEQLSGLRIAAVLDAAGIPGLGQKVQAGHRLISTGVSTILATELRDNSALEHLHHVERTENGRLFVAADGAVTYQDRTVVHKSPYNTSQTTFGDGGGTEIPYYDIELDDGEADILNDIRFQRAGGVQQVAADATSQAKYGVRTLARQNLLNDADSEVLAAAQYVRNNYKNFTTRIRGIELKPHSTNAHPTIDTWPQALGRELGDRITVKKRPMGLYTRSQESHIEGIEQRIMPNTWVTRFALSPADPLTYGIYDDATLGLYGSTGIYLY